MENTTSANDDVLDSVGDVDTDRMDSVNAWIKRANKLRREAKTDEERSGIGAISVTCITCDRIFWLDGKEQCKCGGTATVEEAANAHGLGILTKSPLAELQDIVRRD